MVLNNTSAPESTRVNRLMGEGLIGMAKVARLLLSLKGGRPCHPSTPTRWATIGTTLRNGRRLRLESIRINGRIFTSQAALERYLAAQQEPDSDQTAADAVRSPSAFNQAATRAGEELQRLGA